MLNRPDAVVILSGGLDSSVLFWDLLSQGQSVVAISFNYGQRHSKELSAACAVFDAARKKFGPTDYTTLKRGGADSHHIVDLSNLRPLFGDSSQTSEVPVPEGHYAADNMKATVVPNRNMVMLSVAAAYAMARRIPRLYFGAHGGDHTIYPDCRPDFVSALRTALSFADWNPCTLLAPFIGYDKAYIAKLGDNLKAPLGLTWSCYKGGDLHCGKCGTCVERIEAFKLAKLVDPTKYETP